MKKTIPAESLKGSTVQLIAAMEKANERVQEEGVATKGGNKYLQVSKRMEIFREIFGLEYGIETNILVNDGKTVVVQAKISLNDKVLGTGLAEEIRGRGFVNETSAVENCETSAIGRALASLGIHGGEYASINEIEKAEGIRDHQEQQKHKQEPQDNQVNDNITLTGNAEEDAWHKLSMAWITEINSIPSQASLLHWATKNGPKIEEMHNWDKDNNTSNAIDIQNTYEMRKEELENGSQ